MSGAGTAVARSRRLHSLDADGLPSAFECIGRRVDSGGKLREADGAGGAVLFLLVMLGSVSGKRSGLAARRVAREGRTVQRMWGDREAEAKYDGQVNCDLCGKQLHAGSRWGVCEQTRGNIGGRRRADLVAEDFDLYGWRYACCGSGDVAVAQHTARRCSAEMPRRVTCTAGFGAMAAPGDSRSCACPARTARARASGARSRMSTVRSAAVPVMRSSCWKRSSALTEPPVTGTLAPQDAGRRSQSNEEDR